jgi:hypothetical protein
MSLGLLLRRRFARRTAMATATHSSKIAEPTINTTIEAPFG